MAEERSASDYIAFSMGEVLPPDSILAEWLATLSMAFNDLALIHQQMEADHGTPHRFFYWLRIGIAHFSEAVEYLAETRDIEEVAAFIASLAREAQESCQLCIALYREREAEIQQIRNLTAFHYAELNPKKKNRLVAGALRELGSERGVFKRGTIRDARLLYADDVAATLFLRSTPSWKNVGEIHRDISAGINAFMRFANPAVTAYFERAGAAGVTFADVRPTGDGWAPFGSSGS
jgi:hypothetical protein